MKQKVEIMSMADEILSPITKASNVLLEDGSNVQQLIDNYVEPEFTPTIENSSSMFKVGQGDNVDFSANVINGAYESCMLKGKTLVNYNAEGNDRDEYVCMPSVEGSSLTVNDTVEGKVKSAILKGQTLVNLLNFNSITSNGSKEGNIVTVSANGNTSAWLGTHIYLSKAIERGKKYIAMWDNLEYTHSHANGKMGVIQVLTTNTSTNRDLKLEQTGNDDKNYVIFSCNDDNGDLNKVKIAIQANTWATEEANNTTIVKGLKVLEYRDGMENWDIPYFEGMQSVKMPVLTTINSTEVKITEANVEFGQYIAISDFSKVIVKTSISLGTYKVYIESGNTYIYEGINQCTNLVTLTNGGRMTWMTEDGKSGKYTDDNKGDTIINAGGYSGYIYITVDTENLDKIRFRNINDPIDYKSNILTVNEPIELRGIGDVRDELDCLTGELTNRLGYTEHLLQDLFNFSTGFGRGISYQEASDRWVGLHNGINQAYFNTMLPLNFSTTDDVNSNVSIYKVNTDWFGIAIKSSELVSKGYEATADGLLDYTKNEKMICTYKLPNKVIKTVDLSDSHVYSYKDTTHYICSSEEGSLLPTLTIEEGVKYQAIIKPSTKYSIVFNRTLASDSLTVDLGGATANVSSTTIGKTIVQITTLPTLSHSYVKFLGVGNAIKDVQVIEGDVADDFEYFEGMVDVKNPIVINCNSPIIFGKGGRL